MMRKKQQTKEKGKKKANLILYSFICHTNFSPICYKCLTTRCRQQVKKILKALRYVMPGKSNKLT